MMYPMERVAVILGALFVLVLTGAAGYVIYAIFASGK